MGGSPVEPISLFLCGDVMTGRGIDQILPHPGNPQLYEPWVHDAGEYVELAETAHGPIPRPVSFDYIWGDALPELEGARVDARIVNLETSITSSEGYWPDKEVLYRMHPRNVDCLTAAHISCCCLANNHVLDWGYPGLAETLRTLDVAGLARAGAGRDAAGAASPVTLEVSGKGRVLVFALGSVTSGIPLEWGATAYRAGVYLLRDLSEEGACRVGGRVRELKRPGDVAVVSIHWGGNWGYEVPDEQIAFAHRLIEQGADVVHGHSSHHVKAIEVYQDRPIFYGCGDFLTDYEGIRGYEAFRGDLALMYLVKLDPRMGRLVEARLVPLQARMLRLAHASQADVRWVGDVLNRLGAPFGTYVQPEGDDSLILRWL